MKGIWEVFKSFGATILILSVLPFPGLVYYLVYLGYKASYVKTGEGDGLYFILAIFLTSLFVLFLCGIYYNDLYKEHGAEKSAMKRLHEKDIHNIMKRHDRQTSALKENHRNEIEAANKEWESKMLRAEASKSRELRTLEKEITRLKESHQKQIEELKRKSEIEKEKSETEIVRLKENHQKLIDDLERVFEIEKEKFELEYSQKLNSISRQYDDKEDNLEKDYQSREKRLTKRYEQLLKNLEAKEFELNNLLYSTTPFKDCASLIADLETAVLKDREQYFRYKKNPSLKSAEEVRNLRKMMRGIIEKLKVKEYKLEFLLSMFPGLFEYIDNDEDLIALQENVSSLDELEETRDRSRDYLSESEWTALSESERNQLALDRYIAKRNKSKASIGRDYEMSCGYIYQRQGFNVIYTGIKYGLNDLGRDLIISRGLGGLFAGEKEILLIQCKCWRKGMPIRENVIMQLYGSAVEYNIENNVEVCPVLMIPSFTDVSDMARKFADHLKIQIVKQEFVDFPRIKCNINGDSKIYHLPFDQQYNRTEIKKPGEFYAWSVKEAEDKGFRRAHRHVIDYGK